MEQRLKSHVIEVQHLAVEFQLGRRHGTLLKQKLGNLFSQKVKPPKVEHIRALSNVSFKLSEGRALGVIGANGAGKSTLLKTLAGIIPPKSGNVFVRGKVVPLINLGAGFNPELTGRENIFLAGAIHRIPKKVMETKVREIVRFSEIERFIDTPVKYYSSGMMVRLGFAIATDIDPDILLVDEIFAAGDAFFRRKCETRMRKLVGKARAMVMVSHSMPLIQDLCHEVLVLHRGKVVYHGKPRNAVQYYLENCGDSGKL
ncbi:MAG: ABC transporter ATP-binding protein [Deltaproteobacteria bacterium]|nr:ABC transporter ATP-binding protein [Deltaproteobacteria bacterium]